jgi:lipopolysaccharide biosynthesis regulator YciM
MTETLADWLLLPLGIVLGWTLARKGRSPRTSAAHADSFAEAGSLAQEDFDQAISALSHAAGHDSAGIEIQLTLGSLFRKRGEIDRAIRLHEAALARSGLTAAQAEAARYELAQDYLKAGLLDHAERLLLELAESGSRTVALERLLELYEQSRDWERAIETARHLQSARGQSLAPRIAHYRCELAEAARAQGKAADAQRHFQQALEEDRQCVRASLGLAALAEADKDWTAAIRAYWRALQQDGRFFPEVAPALERCYRETGDLQGYAQFLDEAETAFPDSAAPALAKARWLQAQGRRLRGYLAPHLGRKPTREGLLLWLDGGAEEDAAPASLQPFLSALRKSIQARPRYACRACGLTPAAFYWQCPGCRQWGSIAPVEELL